MTVILKDFYADWCGPCKQLTPILNDIAADRDDFTLEKIDVDDKQNVANQYQVRSLPTIVIETDDGELLDRFVGMTQRDEIEVALDTATQ